MGIVELFKENWVVIQAAPWVFATFAVVFATFGFVVGRHFLAERVSNLRSRLEKRDEEIASLKGQLSTSDGNSDGKRHFLIGQLTAQYLDEHRDASRRMKMGLENPPAEWINAQLEVLEESWRVRLDRDGNYELYEPARWG